MDRYNDFMMPDIDSYEVMTREYEKSLNRYDRKTQLVMIVSELVACKSLILSGNKSLNIKILNSLKDSLSTFDNILDNFYSVFTIPAELNKIKSVNSFNIFVLLKHIAKAIEYIQIVFQQEEKEYFKKITHDSITSLLHSQSNILTALEGCNIHFFKYM